MRSGTAPSLDKYLLKRFGPSIASTCALGPGMCQLIQPWLPRDISALLATEDTRVTRAGDLLWAPVVRQGQDQHQLWDTSAPSKFLSHDQLQCHLTQT